MCKNNTFKYIRKINLVLKPWKDDIFDKRLIQKANILGFFVQNYLKAENSSVNTV